MEELSYMKLFHLSDAFVALPTGEKRDGSIINMQMSLTHISVLRVLNTQLLLFLRIQLALLISLFLKLGQLSPLFLRHETLG